MSGRGDDGGMWGLGELGRARGQKERRLRDGGGVSPGSKGSEGCGIRSARGVEKGGGAPVMVG